MIQRSREEQPRPAHIRAERFSTKAHVFLRENKYITEGKTKSIDMSYREKKKEIGQNSTKKQA